MCCYDPICFQRIFNQTKIKESCVRSDSNLTHFQEEKSRSKQFKLKKQIVKKTIKQIKKQTTINRIEILIKTTSDCHKDNALGESVIDVTITIIDDVQ